MFYEKRLYIPPNTPEDAQVTVDLPIHPGVVQHVELYFPDGCSALAHVAVRYWERQLWPSNPDSYFSGNDGPISFDEDLDIVDPPFILTLTGWNEDDTFKHEPILRVQLLPYDRTLRNIFARLGLGPQGPVTRMEG